MKPHLLHKDRDFDLQRALPWNAEALVQDLALDTLFEAMALGDDFLLQVAKSAVLSGLRNDPDTILYRQGILRDCLKNPDVIKMMYDLAVEAIENKKKTYWGVFGATNPSSILFSSVELLKMFVMMLKRLKAMADKHADMFESEGFRVFFRMLKSELTEEYFTEVNEHLRVLKFRRGIFISAKLGKGNKGINHILLKPPEDKRNWFERIFARQAAGYTFYVAERDESGHRALSDLRSRGINLVANALAQSADHILNFFIMLRTELAFYVGCLTLHVQLTGIGARVSFPLPAATRERRHSFRGLYDVCLALTMRHSIVGNDVNADGRNLVIITGANQGGKSTFLRSIGLSQLMLQCGMFVPAESFCSNLCDGIFTHYKRKEDAEMNSGKLDEELSRMSAIVDNITSDSLLLLNESFAATNEREGSEIARQITCALLERHIKVFFVTHLYAFARGLYEKKKEELLFLQAERRADGGRTYKVLAGEPLQTSFGEDLFHRVFGNVDKTGISQA